MLLIVLSTLSRPENLLEQVFSFNLKFIFIATSLKFPSFYSSPEPSFIGGVEGKQPPVTNPPSVTLINSQHNSSYIRWPWIRQVTIFRQMNLNLINYFIYSIPRLSRRTPTLRDNSPPSLNRAPTVDWSGPIAIQVAGRRLHFDFDLTSFDAEHGRNWPIPGSISRNF